MTATDLISCTVAHLCLSGQEIMELTALDGKKVHKEMENWEELWLPDR